MVLATIEKQPMAKLCLLVLLANVPAPPIFNAQFESKLTLPAAPLGPLGPCGPETPCGPLGPVNALPLMYNPVALTLIRSVVPAAMMTVLANPELTVGLPMMVLLVPVVSAAPAL